MDCYKKGSFIKTRYRAPISFLNKVFSNRIKLGFKGYTQLFFWSFLFCYPSYSYAAPSIHNHTIVSGTQSGRVAQTLDGSVTTIDQFNSLMAIDWHSFNLSEREIVNINQDVKDILLNRVVGGTRSEILGQINADGQVILANPNGVFFGSTASVNVGGLIASGLDINPVNFLNGDLTFSAIDGATGIVSNAGILNASLGGSISLIGQQVINNGMISANLGSVNLAAGKEAVVTFDAQGLVGVHVTKEILQEELGVDPAILNNGVIQAEAGRVLLTASQSQDIFSRAVNNTGINQANSVVVHPDGSFTLGSGADVINNGNISVSTEKMNQDAGQVVVLAENIKQNGNVEANASHGNGGDIEIHSLNTNIVDNGTVSAVSAENGTGGEIKLLGKNVGLFGAADVDASGSQGGGEAYIGGGKRGKNKNLRNAAFVYVSEHSEVKTDALDQGDGGKLITFASDTARIYGGLYSRGGLISGNGGFIETSGLKGFDILKTPDISATAGISGHWLIDPHNITIVGTTGGTTDFNITPASPFTSIADGATLRVDTLLGALSGGAIVTIETGGAAGDATPDLGDIIFDTSIDYDGTGANTLILNAANNIYTYSHDINDSDTSSVDTLNIQFNANSDSTGGGNVIIDSSNIETNGGTFDASGVGFSSVRGTTDTDYIYTAGGNVGLDFTGAVNIGSEIFTGGGDFIVTNAGSFTNDNVNGIISVYDSIGGSVNISSVNNIVLGEIVLGSSSRAVGGNLIATSTSGDIFLEHQLDLEDVVDSSLEFHAGNNITINQRIFDPSTSSIDVFSVTLSANENLNGIGAINLNDNVNTRSGSFTASGISFDNAGFTINTSISGSDINNAGHVNIVASSGAVVLGTVITQTGVGSGNLNVTATSGGITDQGSLSINGKTTLSSVGNDIVLDSANNFVGNVQVVNAHNVTLNDTGAIALGDASGNSVITGFLNVTAVGNITDNGALNVTGVSTFDTNSDHSDIILDHTSNLFQGTINAETQGDNRSDIEIYNTAATTSLGAITAFGTLTVTAENDLDIDGVITLRNIRGGANTRNSSIQFGSTNPLASSFQVNTGGSITTLTGSDDTINLAIDGTTNSNTFNFNSGASLDLDDRTTIDFNGATNASNVFNVNALSTYTVTGVSTNINLNGGTLQDTFNINTPVPASINGGGGSDILNGPNGLNSWLISSTANQGSLTNSSITTSFTSIERINGGTGIDTVTGPNDTVTWTISATGEGNLNNGADLLGVGFFNMENYTGGSGNDRFNVQAGATFGVITGGDQAVAGEDVLDLSQLALVDVEVGVDFSGIERVIGNDSASTLTAENLQNIWTITGNNDGNVVNSNGTVIFEDFNNITGNLDVDEFTFNAGSVITGTIDASGVLNDGVNDVVDYSNLSNQTINLANAFNGVVNAETVRGNDTNLVLAGANLDNTWTITGDNDGSVTNSSGTINFEDFAYLTGGSADDDFTFESAGVIHGVIDGGGATTQDTLVMSAVANVDIVLEGVATVADGDLDITGIEHITGNNTNSVLTGENLPAAWNISGANDGTITITGSATPAITFVDINNLVGGSNDDSFTFTATGSIDSIDGGGQIVRDSVNGSARASFDVAIGSTYTDIERFTGNNTSSSLTGENLANTWHINGANDGSIVNSNGTVQFIDFFSLVGNANDDDFLFYDGGSIAGSIDGAGESTVDTVDYSNASVVNINLASYFVNVSNIEELHGNNSNSTLTGINSTTVWTIDGANSGNYNAGGADTVDFFNFTDLTGGSADDDFNFVPGGSISGLITGGGQATEDTVDMSSLAVVDVTLGSDITGIERITGNNNNSTLTGLTTTNNTFSITDENDGNVGGLTFIDFNNLNGSDFNDSFVFLNDLADITGLIDGGNGAGIDSINGSLTTTFSITIGSGFQNIERVFGNGTASTLVGSNVSNSWSIGNLGDNINDGRIGTLEFHNFNNLTGGSMDDDFTFETNGSLTGLIDGGTGGFDAIDYSALTSVTVNLDPASSNSIINIDEITGNNTNSTLNAADLPTNTWVIDGVNNGDVNGLAFIGFNILNGGANVDNFDIQVGGALGNQVTPDADMVSIVNGQGGVDTFTVTVDGTNNGSIKINGGAGGDSLIIDGSNAAGSYDPTVQTIGPDTYDRITYANGANSMAINFAETENVQDVAVATSYTINGSASDDVIELNNGGDNFNVNGGVSVDYQFKDNILINGQAGADRTDLMGNIGIAGLLEIQTELIRRNNLAEITADTLRLVNVFNAGETGAGNQLVTTLNTLQVSNLTGNLYLQEADSLDIAELATTGVVNIELLAGDLTDSAVLVSNNDFNVISAGGISLDESNQLTGNLSLSAANDIVLNNSTTNIQNISAFNFDLTASGAVTDTNTSNIALSGSLSINATGQDIVLDNAGHDFNNIENVVGQNVEIVDSDAGGLLVTSVSASNNATITSAGDILIDNITAGNTAALLSDGGIIDTNGDNLNLVATRARLYAVAGIGANDAIETQSSIYDVINTGSGKVDVFNTGVLTIEALKNTGSLGDITITNDLDFNINPGSIDAGYNTGELIMTTGAGSYLGIGPLPDFSNADITARAGTFFGFAGTFGTTDRPLVLRIRDSALIQTRASLNPQFAEPRPVVTDESLLQFSGLDTLSAIAGEQLVEVESLAEIDPAIFTDLRNYSYQDISIRMPRDQLYDDELEELVLQ